MLSLRPDSGGFFIGSIRGNHCLRLRESSPAVELIISSTRDNHWLKPRQPLAQIKIAIAGVFLVVHRTRARSKHIEYLEQTHRILGANDSKARSKVSNGYVLGVKPVRMLGFYVARLCAKYGEKHRKKRFMYAFRGLKEPKFGIFCPFFKVGILDDLDLQIS